MNICVPDDSGNMVPTNQQTMAVNLTDSVKVQDLAGGHITVNMQVPSSQPVAADYINILDIVLDNSTKLDFSAPTNSLNVDNGQASIVLTDVDGMGTAMVTHSADGPTISLTPEQVSALTAAAANGDHALSIIANQISNPVTDHMTHHHQQNSMETHSMQNNELVVQTLQSPQLHSQQLQAQSLQTQSLQTQSLQTQSLQTQSLQSQSLQTQSLQTQSLQTQSLQTQSLQSPPLQSPNLQSQSLQSRSLNQHINNVSDTDNRLTSQSNQSVTMDTAVTMDTGESAEGVIIKDDNGDLLEFEDTVELEERDNNREATLDGGLVRFRCQLCMAVFADKTQCKEHMSKEHQLDYVESSPISPKPSPKPPTVTGPKQRHACKECGRQYVTKPALKKHYLLVHKKNYDVPLQKTTSKCIHPGCEKMFYHRQKMIDHLKMAHNVNCVQEDLVFSSWDEFLVWKEKEEDANFVHFSKNSTHTNAKNYMLVNFTCQREGKTGYKYKGGQQKKYKDLVIGEKLCPARMRARLDKPTNRVTVQYCKSHNHKLSFQDFLYRRMPDWLRNEIREKLASGMSSEEIYKEFQSTDNVRENRGERFAPSKRQFVTLVNIKTLAKRMQIKEQPTGKGLHFDAEPVAIQIQKLLDESYKPVLLYKEQGHKTEVGPTEIDQISGSHDLVLIGIQTREQKEMFIKHGSKMVFIDITDTFVTPPFYVATVKVLDDYHKGYPVGYLISNSRDETILFYFFREMQMRICDTDLKIQAVMTENSCNEFYAFRSAFGDDIKHLLCKWNLHRAWCQKIHEECSGDESLQQELYFIFVTMLEEFDVTKFENIATEFVNNYQARCPNFITFFMTNYLSQPEVWATCHRNVSHSDCDEILYGDRLQDRFLKETKTNQRIKSIDDVLDVILKFEHEDYFNRGLNLLLDPPEPELQFSEHDRGMRIGNSNVSENQVADNRWFVKTLEKDPADLSSMKEETYIVTWKADVCEKDFCRERCLKLACFGLCGHLYHCSCDLKTITPCRHVHKVHSMRIGVTQCQAEQQQEMDVNKPPNDSKIDASGVSGNQDVVLTTTCEPHVNTSPPKEEAKLNLITQAHVKPGPNPEEIKKQKLAKIKSDILKIYRFLDSDNIQRYSLDFIGSGLKSIISECKVIDSIGQIKTEVPDKYDTAEKDERELDMLAKKLSRQRNSSMGVSAPVVVEIEQDLQLYNTFRKRVTGSSEETPEDRMAKLSQSEVIRVSIESNPKFRGSHLQQTSSTPNVIVAKEEKSLEGFEDVTLEFVPSVDVQDKEWKPNARPVSKRGGHAKRGRPRKVISEGYGDDIISEQTTFSSPDTSNIQTVPDMLVTTVSDVSLTSDDVSLSNEFPVGSGDTLTHSPLCEDDSNQLDTDQLNSDQLNSDQLNSDQLDSDQLGSDQLGSNQLESNRLESTDHLT